MAVARGADNRRAATAGVGVLQGAGRDMTETAAIRVAVIGAGYLGRFHAQKWATLPGCRLIAVADPAAEVRAALGQELGVEAVEDWRVLLARIDAVSIATPTPLHHPIARACLEAGVHVLVEKPITTTVAEARELIEVAARARRVLQVGHLERFNAAVLAIEGIVTRPRFIESHRLAPFRQRGTDVSVVLDLMIHDIDLIQSIVRAPLTAVDAIGSSVFSDDLDIANARLRFASGCVANVTASRVSLKTERKLRLFQDDLYLSLDLQQKIVTVIRKGAAPTEPGGMPQVAIEEKTYEQGDALKAQIEAFASSIRSGRAPLVDGAAGLEALETATRIATLVRAGADAG
jgi:predicted dehydrogenase